MMSEIMKETAKLIKSLLESTVEYGKTSFELAKLKALDKTSDVVSTMIPHTIVIVLIASFMLLFNLGLAFLLGEILGKIYYGFFVVAAFYGLSAIVMHFFMHKQLKNYIGNYFIKQVLS